MIHLKVLNSKISLVSQSYCIVYSIFRVAQQLFGHTRVPTHRLYVRIQPDLLGIAYREIVVHLLSIINAAAILLLLPSRSE